MKRHAKSVQSIIDDQVRRWDNSRKEHFGRVKTAPVVTVSRLPGTCGKEVARMLAESMGLDLFDREIIQQVAESAKISKSIIESLDEKGRGFVEELISELVDTHSLLPDEYLKHLMHVINTIGRHGGAVIVGRGANYILPRENTFSLRLVAPFEMRVEAWAKERKLGMEDAAREVITEESNRQAFVRKYFHMDVSESVHYDLILNMKKISVENAVEAVKAAMNILWA